MTLEGEKSSWGSVIDEVELTSGESTTVNLTVNIDDDATSNDFIAIDREMNRVENIKDQKETAANICKSLRLPDEVLNMQESKLSVGQQQRVAVARALIGNPPLIIADEPTSALDKNAQSIFLDLMFSQISESHSTLLMVSHDESLTQRFDRVINLDDILKEGN